MDGLENGNSGNPLAFLGLQRVGSDIEDSPIKRENGIELNSRGIPARKKNSLIYGADDVVSIPVKSPKKKFTSPTKPIKEQPEKFKHDNSNSMRGKIDRFEDEFDEDFEEELDDDKSIDFYEEELEAAAKPVKIIPKKKEVPETINIKNNDLDEEISVANRLNAQRLGV